MSQLYIPPEVLDALQRLSSLPDADDVIERTLATVVDLSVATVPGCVSAGVTLRVAGKDTTAAASDDYALDIDEIQYDENEGPCVAAIEDGEVKAIAAVAEESRWPNFCRRAAEKGFRSSLSIPLNADGTSGALNLYSQTNHSFDEASRAVAEVFAKQAAVALRNAKTYDAARRQAEQLNEALRSRDLIGQAKGILMEREDITDDEAFARLKALSQNSNVKLRDVAQRVVDERVRTRP